MPESPHLVQWIAALGLMGLMTWVALDLLAGVLPWSLLDSSRPGRREIGLALIVALALLGFVFLREIFDFVWLGIRHLLLLDLEGL